MRESVCWGVRVGWRVNLWMTGEMRQKRVQKCEHRDCELRRERGNVSWCVVSICRNFAERTEGTKDTRCTSFVSSMKK